MAGAYVIGVDGGTESLRAGVFDLRGKPLAFAATAYETRFPAPGLAEQDPRDWWRAIGASVRQAVAEAGISPTEVAGIAV
ncbi:MAG: glycerol kinase, partial [Kiloniellales bacterium]|nr:glycerol kinase [Kiloniellales bacterium]